MPKYIKMIFHGGVRAPLSLKGKYSFPFWSSCTVLCCLRPGGCSCFIHRLCGRGLSGLIAVDYDVRKAAHCQSGANTA